MQAHTEPRPDVSADLDVTGSAPPVSGLRFPVSTRRGLTLIEMLMATAITLLMMAAVVTLFANLSGSISNRRALIEISGQLRQVRQRLARDLAGCTVPPGPQGLMPWRQRPGEAIGYFEILEGGRSDANPSSFVDGIDTAGNYEIDYQTSLVPSGGDPLTLLPSQVGRRVVNDDDVTNGGGLGDADDVLALTVRSLGDPFTANVRVPVDYDGDGIWDENDNGIVDENESESQRIESNLAEVIWYAREIWPVDEPSTPGFFENRVNPYDPDSAIGEPGMRIIYRRELLIAPWLTPIPAGVGPFFGDLPYDGKVSVHRELMNPSDPTDLRQMWVPNTLADLTRREYRFAHELDYSRLDWNFPHELDLRDINGIYSREYVVLDNALAFDVRVFDPGAPVYLVGATTSPPIDGTPVDPVDAGWQAAVAVGGVPASYGAYVDLGWNNAGTYDYRTIPGAVPTVFQEEHQLGWHPLRPLRGLPAVYDTWTWHYENDGRDQDNRDGDGDITTGADEGTNGRDDPLPGATAATPTRANGENGVDDVLERETSPPYPYPLRAVKVVLRVYERDARQVRETSVTNSFVP